MKKHILINGRFLLQPVTGVQRFAREVIAEFLKIEQDTIRFSVAVPEGKLIFRIPDLDTYVDYTSLSTALWQQIRLPLLMRNLNADLLWSPCNVGPIFAKNHVVSIHDTSVFAGPMWFSSSFRAYYRFLFPQIGKRAVKVLTPSLFSKKEIFRHGIAPENRINIIPGGVHSRFSPQKTRRSEKPYVLTVGSRDPRKNVSRLIDAWEEIPSDIKQGRTLVVAGRGARSYSSEQLHGIPDDVRLTGFVDDKKLPYLYSGADAFIFPSQYEGFGLTLLEAMACGCPVVASNTASMPEVCGDAVYYIDPYSVQSIAEGITRVLTDNELREMLVDKGLLRVKHFTWEMSAKEHMRVFKEVLGSY